MHLDIQETTNTMATAKKTTTPVKKTTAAKKAAAPAKTATVKGCRACNPDGTQAVKDPFNKTTLVAHLATQAGVEPKTARPCSPHSKPPSWAPCTKKAAVNSRCPAC